MSLQDLKNRLQKHSKGSYIEVMCDSEISKITQFFNTPSYDLNRIVSGSLYKGFPEKSVVCLVAPEGAFKSSMMCITASNAQKDGYTPVIIDTEGAWTSDFCKRWGLDVENALHIYTPFVEDITTIFGDIIDNKEQKLFIVLDSLGGLESKKVIDDTTKGDRMAKADQGQLAKKIKRMLKMMVCICKSQSSASMFSAHFYGKPDSYGATEDIGGGKYVKLAADIILSMKKTPIYENPKAAASDRVVIGNRITAITQKNRFCPPFQETVININYQDGVDVLGGIAETAINCGIIEGSGAWFTIGDQKFHGMKNVYEHIKENSEQILEMIEERIKETGYSSVNTEESNDG